MRDDRQHDRKRSAAKPWRRWYKTARWLARRARQLATEPLCRSCRKRGKTTAATVADHVTPHRGDADLFWHGELQSLCASCHSRAKQALEAGGRVPVGRDGWPIAGLGRGGQISRASAGLDRAG